MERIARPTLALKTRVRIRTSGGILVEGKSGFFDLVTVRFDPNRGELFVALVASGGPVTQAAVGTLQTLCVSQAFNAKETVRGCFRDDCKRTQSKVLSKLDVGRFTACHKEPTVAFGKRHWHEVPVVEIACIHVSAIRNVLQHGKGKHARVAICA